MQSGSPEEIVNAQTYLETSFRRVRLGRLGGAISLSTRLATCLACARPRMLAKRNVMRPGDDCLVATATRLPLPPGIFAFESRKVEFVSDQEGIRDRIDG